jgi:MFS family permease
VTPPLSQERVVLVIIPLVYFVFVAAEFGAMTYLALAATEAGRSAFAVGLLAASMWTGILLASLAAHSVIARLGYARSFVAGTTISTISLASFALHEVFALWSLAALNLGLGAGLVWVAGESWLAEAAPPRRRGFFVGLFETAVGLGLMVGPLIIPTARSFDLDPLLMAGVVMAMAWVSSLFLPGFRRGAASVNVSSNPDPALASWWGPTFPLLAVALLSGVMESGISALLPSISMRLGADLQQAALLGTVIGAGSALLQPPAGHMGDRWGVRNTTLIAWAMVALATIALWVVAESPGSVLWWTGFVLGGAGGAIYTLSIVELGHRLSGSALVKAVSALVIVYALGTALSPALGGLIFDQTGLSGFAAVLVTLSLAGLLVTWITLRSHR